MDSPRHAPFPAGFPTLCFSRAASLQPYIKGLHADPQRIAPDRDAVVALYDGEIHYADAQVGRLR